VPDDKDDDIGQPMPLKPIVVKAEAEDAIEPDTVSDEIERLEREAAPRPKLCPHCGKPLQFED
jgi:hypothetical protein